MAVLLALLVGGGWWVVRGPMVVKPVALAPEVDLDSPMPPASGRPSAEVLAHAALSPASTSARAMPAVAGASAVASCSADEGPQYAAPEERDGMWMPSTAQIKGATPGFIAGQARIDAALRRSADPFDRAAADLLNAGEARTASGSIDALVQQASSTQDPRVYSLAMRACAMTTLRVDMLQEKDATVPASCAALDARRWATLDPGNGTPWLWVLARANAAQDADARREAFAHLSAATRFDYQPLGVAAAVASHAGVATDGNAAFGMIVAGLGQAAVGIPPQVGLLQACRGHAGGDAALEKQCATIATTMYEHSDSLLLHNWAGTITFALNGDATRRDAARAEMRAMGERHATDTPAEPCAALQYSLRHFVRSNEIGELQALREASSAPAKP